MTPNFEEFKTKINNKMQKRFPKSHRRPKMASFFNSKLKQEERRRNDKNKITDKEIGKDKIIKEQAIAKTFSEESSLIQSTNFEI
jgi:hypothetical protein